MEIIGSKTKWCNGVISGVICSVITPVLTSVSVGVIVGIYIYINIYLRYTHYTNTQGYTLIKPFGVIYHITPTRQLHAKTMSNSEC